MKTLFLALFYGMVGTLDQELQSYRVVIQTPLTWDGQILPLGPKNHYNTILRCRENKTRDIICLENSEEEDEETQNLNNNSVVLDRVTKKTEVHETLSVSPTINSGTIKEYLTELGLGILRCHENGIVLFHCDNLWLNGKNASEADASPSDIRR